MKKKVCKLFFNWEDNKEEEWLGKMAEKGWLLTGYNSFFYSFEKGEAKNYVYKLDYRVISNKEKEEYVNLFADAGWEHAAEFAGWHYFRAEGEGGELDIFSDTDSKVQKYKRLLQMIYLPYIAVFLIGMVVVFPGPYSVMKWIYSVLFLLLSLAIIKIKKKITRLKSQE